MKELLRKIPKVDELLRNSALAEAAKQYGDRAVTEAIRLQLDILRQGILNQQITVMPELSDLCQQICRRVQQDSLPSLNAL